MQLSIYTLSQPVNGCLAGVEQAFHANSDTITALVIQRCAVLTGARWIGKLALASSRLASSLKTVRVSD